MEANAGDEDGKVCTLYEKKADTMWPWVCLIIHVL